VGAGQVVYGGFREQLSVAAEHKVDESSESESKLRCWGRKTKSLKMLKCIFKAKGKYIVRI